MARSLTTAAATEASKNTGAFPRRVLEVQYGGSTGTKYYSSDTFTPTSSGFTTDPRVKSWGTITTAADPNKMGGNSQLTIELADTDHVLKGLFDTSPGIQTVQCKLWLWFSGTAWSDAVCLFVGTISNPVTWQDASGTWKCTDLRSQSRNDSHARSVFRRPVHRVRGNTTADCLRQPLYPRRMLPDRQTRLGLALHAVEHSRFNAHDQHGCPCRWLYVRNANHIDRRRAGIVGSDHRNLSDVDVHGIHDIYSRCDSSFRKFARNRNQFRVQLLHNQSH